jgi:hypothetical protein
VRRNSMVRRLRLFRGDVRWVLAAVVALALVISPFAIAQQTGLIGGKRNPRSGAFRAETKVIANTSQFGMRYSNRAQGEGGGALLGCRAAPGGSPARQFPCMRASNVGTGLAFEIATRGSLGGTITARGGDNAKPFTTNATGVATGLNAERVGSMTPAQLTSAAVAAVQATLPIARVSPAGAAITARGVSGVSHASTGTYSVVFQNPVNGCALTATQSTSGTAVGAVGTELGADNRTVTVTTLSSAGALADRAFDISAVC